MARTEYKVFLDNVAADAQTLERFAEIRVDQGIDMAAEAELQVPIGVDDTGVWSGVEEDFAQPFARIRVEVKTGDSGFVPLIDGPVVAQRFELDAAPNASSLVLVVQDDSVLLNRDEAVELFEDLSPDAVAQQLFAQAGLSARTDAVASPAGGFERYLVRRGTAMQMLKELARRHGLFVYVEPDSAPGTSVGYFVRPVLAGGEFPQLLLMGAERNINRFSAEFDALRPLRARAANLAIAGLQPLESESQASDLQAQGEEPVHDVVEAGVALMARTREMPEDLDAATAAAVNHSSWAYSANAEVQADLYGAVLRPHRVVSVAGAGARLSGEWLISRVTHTLRDTGYSQSVALKRNARSAGAGAALPGGIF